MLTKFVIPVKFFQVIGRVFVRLTAFSKLNFTIKRRIFFFFDRINRNGISEFGKCLTKKKINGKQFLHSILFNVDFFAGVIFVQIFFGSFSNSEWKFYGEDWSAILVFFFSFRSTRSWNRPKRSLRSFRFSKTAMRIQIHNNNKITHSPTII